MQDYNLSDEGMTPGQDGGEEVREHGKHEARHDRNNNARVNVLDDLEDLEDKE